MESVGTDIVIVGKTSSTSIAIENSDIAIILDRMFDVKKSYFQFVVRSYNSSGSNFHTETYNIPLYLEDYSFEIGERILFQDNTNPTFVKKGSVRLAIPITIKNYGKKSINTPSGVKNNSGTMSVTSLEATYRYGDMPNNVYTFSKSDFLFDQNKSIDESQSFEYTFYATMTTDFNCTMNHNSFNVKITTCKGDEITKTIGIPVPSFGTIEKASVYHVNQTQQEVKLDVEGKFYAKVQT